MITGGQPCFLAALLVAFLSADSPFDETPVKTARPLIDGQLAGSDADVFEAKRADRNTRSPGEASLWSSHQRRS